jgi:hypothetical protein
VRCNVAVARRRCGGDEGADTTSDATSDAQSDAACDKRCVRVRVRSQRDGFRDPHAAPTPKPKPPKVPGAHIGTVLGHTPKIKHEGNGKSGIVQHVLEKLRQPGPQKRKHLERIFWHLANASVEAAHETTDHSSRERTAKGSYSDSDGERRVPPPPQQHSQLCCA